MARKNKLSILFALIPVFVVGAFFIYKLSTKTKPPVKQQQQQQQQNFEPTFRKDGELTFADNNNKLLKKISIEIADSPGEREQGLMYRHTMPDSCGMLFLFDVAEPQSFWMKNTILPLDIIYVGEDYKIVTIAKNAVPYSEEAIPSVKPAKFVVEVNAGFTDEYNIKEGTTVNF
ncbi:MAG: DUF192 domain-containing protein [Bacteroidota bacterium]